MDQPSEPGAHPVEGQAPTRAGQPGHDYSRIAQDLQIRRVQVDAVARLLDEGYTVPFIVRFRKDRTQGLDDAAVRQIARRLSTIRAFQERKKNLLANLSQQGRLVPELESAIAEAETPKRLDDLTLPFRQRRRSPSHAAREKGLGPLAEAIWLADPALTDLDAILEHWADPELKLDAEARAAQVKTVREGVVHILSEVVADTADIRSILRDLLWGGGRLTSTKQATLAEGQGLEHREFFAYAETLRQFPAHKVQALFRAEKANAVQVKFEWDHQTAGRVVWDFFPLPEPDKRPIPSYQGGDQGLAPLRSPEAVPEAAPVAEISAPVEAPAEVVESAPAEPTAVVAESATSEQVVVAAAQAVPAPIPPAPIRAHGSVLPPFPIQPVPPRGPRPDLIEQHPFCALLTDVVTDALNRLLIPALEREARRELGQRAEELAAQAFGRNLFNRLMTPPFLGKRVLGIDPGFRAGCRLAVIDERGRPLEYATIHPHAPHDQVAEARLKIEELVRRFEVDLIAIGNNNASRPTEVLLSDLLATFGRRRRGEPEPELVVVSTPEPAAEVVATSEVVSAEEAAPQEAVAAVETVAVEAAPEVAVTAPVEGEAPVAELNPEDVPLVFPPLSERPVVEKPQVAPAVNLPPPPPPVDFSGLSEPKESLSFCVVAEAGAGASEPDEDLRGVDAGLRAAVSIARRLQDPLTELVRIEPQHLVTGAYPFDTNSRVLRDILNEVVESAIGAAGGEINHVNPLLLVRTSGFNAVLARELIARKGGLPGQRYSSREQLREVPGIDALRFELSAGFLKVDGGSEPLDGTWIHPESYPVARRILTAAAIDPSELANPEVRETLATRLSQLDLVALHDSLRQASQLGELAGPLPSPASLNDMVSLLARPGRDPRLDHEPPVLRQSVLTIDKLVPGMELRGNVLNVVEFGTFVDIGMREAGLVHISQLANRFVRNPFEFISVGDAVRVWVLTVDRERSRVSLTMIAPGTERARGEQGPGGRGERGEPGQPRGPRPPRREGGAPRGDGAPRPDGPPRGPARRPEGARPGGGPGRDDRPPARRPDDRAPRRPGTGEGSRFGDKAAPGALPPRGKTRKEMDTPRGRRDGPRPGGGAPTQPAGGAPADAPVASTGNTAPRKPQKSEPSKPKISEEALAGRNPLGSFAELAAFLAAQGPGGEKPPTDPAS